jgi:signal transduction histidine kinase
VPLGLPPHLATRTTLTAVSRAAHAGAAVCLSAVGLVVLTIQADVPQVIVWPALVVLIPMIVLLVLLERTPSVFIAASYLGIGGLCVVWYTLIASVQLDTPVANDDFTIVLLKFALILVMGVGPGIGAAMVWTTAGYLIGEAAAAIALMWLGSPWSFDPASFAAWFIVMGLLGVLRADLLSGRHAQTELYRAARDEMLADVRHGFEQRATALLHDTVLNQLAVITASGERLSPEIRTSMQADLEAIVGQEWFAATEPARSDADALGRAHRLRSAVDEARGEVVVGVDGDPSGLDRLDADTFDELVRAVVQCITNVRRHAATDSAEILLGASDAEVSVMVIDAGQGFAVDACTDGRLGVGTSIVGRLETVGGSATVWSQPGRGTSVLLRVPARPVEGGGAT